MQQHKSLNYYYLISLLIVLSSVSFQSFLYALVDLLAVSDVVVGVFGISSRLDTKDLLERRVLSRYAASSSKQLAFKCKPNSSLASHI